jgi:hypothetical protein
MNKTAKGIIALGAVLAVLGGGYAALRLTEPKEEGGSSASSEVNEDKQSVILIKDDENESASGYNVGVIKTVDIKNQTDELHVIQKTAKTDDSAATYTLDGYQDVLMKDSIIGTLANNANELASEDVIEENCTDLAKFGLASPTATVDIEYESGKKYRLLVGNKAPSGDVTYVMIDGVNTVYTVRNSAVENYTKTTIELVETTVLEAPDEMPIVKTLKIERDDIDYDIVLKYEEKEDSQHSGGTSAAHVMVEPTTAYLAVERATNITTGMFGLDAQDIYSVHCTDADIAEAGLKDPFCTVTMECDDGKTYVLLLSEPFNDSENGKCCYAMLEGGNVIYTVQTENARWATVKPIDIASKIFIASYVWNISDLKVTTNTGESGEFTITKRNPAEEKESYTADDFEVKYNGEAFDSERFRQFYSFLISANAEDFALDAKIPDSAPMATVELNDSFTGETMKLDFYENSAMTALIAVNGESKFTITKSYVDTLIDNIKRIKGDEEFVTTWK